MGHSSTNTALPTSNPSGQNHPQLQPLHFSQAKYPNCLRASCPHTLSIVPSMSHPYASGFQGQWRTHYKPRSIHTHCFCSLGSGLLCWEMGQLRIKGLNSKVLRSPGPIQPHSSPSYAKPLCAAKSHCLGQILNPLSTEPWDILLGPMRGPLQLVFVERGSGEQ